MVGPENHSEGRDSLQELVKAGAEVAGEAAGAALGFITGGPVGAVGGAAAAPLLTRGVALVAREIRKRILSPREERRIGATLAFALEEIKERLEAGQPPRQDGFFERELPSGGTSAEEVLEGMLLTAQRSYEERKLPYLGKLYATIAFDPGISPATGHTLIRLMDELSYRQVVLLSLFGQNGGRGNQFGLREELYGSGAGAETGPLGHEIYDLHNRAMAWRHDPGSESGATVFGPVGIRPAYTELEGLGSLLFRAARLDTVPREDVEALARELRPQ